MPDSVCFAPAPWPPTAQWPCVLLPLNHFLSHPLRFCGALPIFWHAVLSFLFRSHALVAFSLDLFLVHYFSSGTVLENYAFLVYMYYMHSGYQTFIFGKKLYVLCSNFWYTTPLSTRFSSLFLEPSFLCLLSMVDHFSYLFICLTSIQASLTFRMLCNWSVPGWLQIFWCATLQKLNFFSLVSNNN